MNGERLTWFRLRPRFNGRTVGRWHYAEGHTRQCKIALKHSHGRTAAIPWKGSYDFESTKVDIAKLIPLDKFDGVLVWAEKF